MQVGLEDKLEEATLITAEENADLPINCSPPCGQEPPEENFPEVVLTGLGVKKCHRCRGKLKKRSAHPIKITYFVFRHCKYGKTQNNGMASMLWQWLLPIYHIMCKKHKKEMTVKDVATAKDTLALILPNHLHFLHQKEFLGTIVAKLKCWEGPLCSAAVVSTKTLNSYS